MTKQLYEEALADARRLTEVAEDNAKRAVLEAVTPRIKQLIERELLSELAEESDDLLFDDDVGEPGEVATTMPPGPVPVAARGEPSAEAISMPDEQGKVTLDLDALDGCQPGVPVPPPMFGEPVPVPEEEEYVLGLESLTALRPMINNDRKLQTAVNKLAEAIRGLKSTNKALRETTGYGKQIAQMISRVENMYEYVQERITNPAKKKLFEDKLEGYFKELTKLQELKMSNKLKDLIKEDDELNLGGGDDAGADEDVGDEGGDVSGGPGELTLKLTGLPDDLNLDNVGVDLVADDESGDEGTGDEGGDEGGDDLGDLDLGGGDETESGDQMESVQLSDDTIVEIDENMLRREIARMRKLRESGAPSGDATPPSSDGEGVNADVLHDFGGAAAEGDPFEDGEVTTEGEDVDEGDEVTEGDEYMPEGDDMEPPPVAELQNRRKADQNGVSANSDMGSVAYEAYERKLSVEKRIQERAKARAKALKQEARSARPAKKALLQKEYVEVAKRHNASVTRAKKISEQLAEAKQLATESRSNSGSQPAESKAVTGLRKQLTEKNLLNVKLVYANKLLQNESLTKRQKAQIIERLDDAKTVREAKLVYESLTKALGTNKPLKEGRDAGRILGSSSRTTRPGSRPQALNEGFETDRWAQLAGITKR